MVVKVKDEVEAEDEVEAKDKMEVAVKVVEATNNVEHMKILSMEGLSKQYKRFQL